MSAEVEEDHLLLPTRLAPLCFIDYRTDRVRGLGGREYPFCPREEGCGLDRFELVVGDRIDDPPAAKETEGGGGPVNPEASRVHDGWDEGVPDRVHLEEGAGPHYVCVVVDVFPLRELRGGRRFSAQELDPLRTLLRDAVTVEGPEYSREVASTSHASDNHVWIFIESLQLSPRLLSHDRLTGQDKIHDAPHGVPRVGVAAGVLESLALRDAHRPGSIRVFPEYLSPHLGPSARAGKDLGPPAFSQVLSIGFTLVGRAGHVYRALYPKD